MAPAPGGHLDDVAHPCPEQEVGHDRRPDLPGGRPGAPPRRPDRPPTRVGVSIGDTLAGLLSVIGALMGLLSQHRLGADRGETVDVALHEAVYSIMESTIPEYSAYGTVRSRTGNQMPGVAPSNTYPCRDGDWVVIGGNADGIFHRLMTAIGRPDLAADGRFQDNRGR